jgi:transposase InsO family protein
MKRKSSKVVQGFDGNLAETVPLPVKNRRKECPARGKRYSKGVRKKILQHAEVESVADAEKKFGVSAATIYEWRRKGLSAAPIETVIDGDDDAIVSQKDRDERILGMWKRHPGYGPSQVRNMLKREGLKASVSTVRRVMEENGYVPPRMKAKERTGRYEAARPRELYHMDFYHFHVHKQKQCLLFIQDDYSRFIVGWALAEVEKAEPVIECFQGAVTRYGKPEGVMSDRGSAFHSWRGISRFERLLEEYEVNFYLAKEAAVNGKVEALNAAFQKECLLQREFMDLSDAARAIAAWVDHFNHKRTHHGLGGLLVPADRFYGLAERTLKMIEMGQGATALDLLSPDCRGLELFKIVSHEGVPQIYLMGRKLLD